MLNPVPRRAPHLVVDVQLREDGLHHAPVEGALCHVLAPVVAQAVGGLAQVVPGDFGGAVVGHVPADVVAQELDPAQERRNSNRGVSGARTELQLPQLCKNGVNP